MKKIILTLLTPFVFSMGAKASDGVITVESEFSVAETMSRFELTLKEKGLNIFAKIDHSENASKVNLKLRPTQVIIFGNPKAGTPLMQCQQQLAIDLPQKALFWQDEKGKVWLSYNDPEYLTRRHGADKCGPVVGKIAKVLQSLSRSATSQ